MLSFIQFPFSGRHAHAQIPVVAVHLSIVVIFRLKKSIIIALSGNYLEIVKLLIDAGADVNQTDRVCCRTLN